jgi:hypothetical protein
MSHLQRTARLTFWSPSAEHGDKIKKASAKDSTVSENCMSDDEDTGHWTYLNKLLNISRSFSSSLSIAPPFSSLCSFSAAALSVPVGRSSRLCSGDCGEVGFPVVVSLVSPVDAAPLSSSSSSSSIFAASAASLSVAFSSGRSSSVGLASACSALVDILRVIDVGRRK